MKIEEIFDADTYDEFIGVTYSMTPSFMNTYLAGFSRIKIVVGIQENQVQYKVNQMAKQMHHVLLSVLQNESVSFYKGLSANVRTQIAKKAIEVNIPLGVSIHSKFYLLRNLKTEKTRIILGSANLSEQAFLSSTPQYENIVIYDNHALFDIYYEYFHSELSDVLTNYFPKELLAINAARAGKTGSPEEVILLRNE